MYNFDASDVVDAFKRAKNLNAAVKAFLKNQGNNQDPKNIRFAKDLRETVQSSNFERVSSFVMTHFSAHRDTLISVAACAHAELITSIIGGVADKYSDEFNATYELTADGIDVKEEKDFEKIAAEAIKIIENDLKDQGWTNPTFLKAVVLNQLFDRSVYEELDRRKLLQ